MTSEVIEHRRPALHPWRSFTIRMTTMSKRSLAAWSWILAIAMSLSTGVATAADSPVARAPHVDAQHARLAGLAGHWSVRQSMWTDPKSPPVIDHGDASYAMVLGGRHLRQQLRIASSKAFEGLGYIGYDDATGRYYSSWMDTNFSGIILAYGSYDAASRTYSLTGEMAGKHGASVPVREVMRIADHDHFTYEFYETRGGKEALAIRLQYTRMDG
jgi:hypothetical protein